MTSIRIWHSTDSFANYIFDNTDLKNYQCQFSSLYESDASKPNSFHSVPDHIKKILYLDCPDLIVELNSEPLFSIEISTEAGTGHNAFQRFARIAASVENGVPAFYIYPEAVIIERKNVEPKWDSINPLIFHAFERVMQIYNIPALMFYFPSDYQQYQKNCSESPNFRRKGLKYDKDFISYPGCPDHQDPEMRNLFQIINCLLKESIKDTVISARQRIMGFPIIGKVRDKMNRRFGKLSIDKDPETMSPLSAVLTVKTTYLLNYLRSMGYKNIGELLQSREDTIIYQADAKFRGDPYPGALCAVDYLKARRGKTFEDRECNLVLAFGKVTEDHENETLLFESSTQTSIDRFCDDVKKSQKRNLLSKNFKDLKVTEIPRYYMHVRYGSTYSKPKHIRVYSYFSDAILFQDGALWRDG